MYLWQFQGSSSKSRRDSCVTFQKKDPKSYFLTSSDPQTCPGAKFLHHCILLFITFDLISNMTMFVQNGFWTPPPPPLPTTTWPVPRDYIKIPNVFLQSSSLGLYRLWKFWDSSLNGLGAMVWHYRRTYGRPAGRTDGRMGVSQYPRFFFEKRGDNNMTAIALNIRVSYKVMYVWSTAVMAEADLEVVRGVPLYPALIQNLIFMGNFGCICLSYILDAVHIFMPNICISYPLPLDTYFLHVNV